MVLEIERSVFFNTRIRTSFDPLRRRYPADFADFILTTIEIAINKVKSPYRIRRSRR